MPAFTNNLLSKPDDYFLLALILGAPLFGAFFNGVFGRRLGRNAVRFMTLSAMFASFAAAIYTFVGLTTLRHRAEETAAHAFQAAHPGQAVPHELAVAPTKLAWLAWKWMSMSSPDGAGRFSIDAKFSVDELSGTMMLIITGVGFLIHIYATSYMAKDPGYHRFFAYLNLFVFSMLTLVLADNMPLMFVGWEGVGLCSYLLIGFWYENADNTSAGRKAFIANRIGDVGMIGGMLVIAYYTNALDWAGINTGAEHLIDPANRIVLWARPGNPLTVSPATVACLALFLGCTGKSAQIPLYVWLPDAMAGPTPVSALIHAATMVTSGLYLICRLNLVFSFSPFAMMVVACVGALTALFAATIALVQNDIKKVLAYSTVSQLGFMFLGVGVGAFGAGFFHVLTHAFFKACLFLGAGSVIHAMHARVHDDVKSQDMRNMGGLRKFMPWTYYSMGAATLAIAGMPLTSGFFSKDGILFHVWGNRVMHPDTATAEAVVKEYAARGMTSTPAYHVALRRAHAFFEAPQWLGKALFVVGILAATCTAFYMFRLLFKTFWGEFRGWTVDPKAELAIDPFQNEHPLEELEETHSLSHTLSHAEADEPHGAPTSGVDAHSLVHEHRLSGPPTADPGHRDGDDEVVDHGHDDHHHEEDLAVPGAAPAEAPWPMALPVAILGALALFAGFLYAEPFHIEPLGRWLMPVFREAAESTIKLREGVEKLELPLMLPGVCAFAVGAYLAFAWYVQGDERVPFRLARQYPRLHRAAYNKWYVDEIYEATVIGGTDALADGAALMDAWIVDGIIAKLTAMIASALGALLRSFQTGVVHVYACAMGIGVLVLVFFFGTPHAELTMKKAGDSYSIEAAPGLGYEYKWDLGDGKAETEFTAGDVATKRTVPVESDKSKTVTLEVKNAFGRTTRRVVELTNPKPTPLGLPRPAASPTPPPGH